MAESSTVRRHMIPSACNECRKKRTKCDGELPCSRCRSREGLVCVYEPHLKQTKEVLQAELGRIRGESQAMEAVLNLLKNHDQPEIVLDQLRSGQTLESIARFGSPTTFSSGIFASPGAMIASISESDFPMPNMERPQIPKSDTTRLFLENRYRPPDPEHQGSGQFPSAKWTAATSNNGLVEHLLSLYFCWEYPTFASLSKEHFIYDFKSGTPRYCSSLLVNALLALGARSSDIPEARKYPTDPESAGEHFFEEAKRLLGSEDVPTLPTVQALGLMSLRQASCGKDVSSFIYARQSLRMALDIDLHSQNPASRATDSTTISQAEREVRIATFWGCFNLEQAWCLCIGRVSQVTPGLIHIDKPEEVDEIEDEDWSPYTDAGIISRDYHQPNNVRSVYRCFSELSEIINWGVSQINSQSHSLENQQLLSIYHKLLIWYDGLPDQLRLGANFTPTVLFIHMYYHFTILILFRPFRDEKLSGSATAPREVCTEASQNLLTLIKSYKDLYTLRRVPSFAPYMILTAKLAHLVDLALKTETFSSESTDLASMSYLEEMSSSHKFAKRALDILDYFSEVWEVETREDKDLGPLRSRQRGTGKVLHPASEVSGSETFFLPSLQSSIESKSGALHLINVLFPQQGRPLSIKSDRPNPSDASQEVEMER